MRTPKTSIGKLGQGLPLALLAAAGIAVLLAGCSREKYYRLADREAKALIYEKSTDPRWAAPCDYSIAMDPKSRFYDECNQIRPPMPPDDPTSHKFMHCVDGKKGYKHWHRDGDRCNLENSAWMAKLAQYVPLNTEGQVVLSLRSAMDLARVNSPDYQDQLETLYLSALDVSTERFRFDVQFFGGNDLTFAHQGRLARGGELNTLENDIGFQARRHFATAGDLLVGFANSMVWQFAGPDTSANVSLLNFNLVQPLLRGAGQNVALEQLTITERGLLANLRALQRYRQGFYARVAIGDSSVTGPQRRGGFFGGTGLTGFTGTGAAGLGGVGTATGYGRAGFGAGGTAGGGGGGTGFAGGGAGTVLGFVGMLQQLQQIRNTQENLNAQLRTLGLLEAHLAAGTIDLTQVDQFRQNIETERATLLQSQNAMEDTIESYNTGTLGLPPYLPVELDDSMIRQFQLIDPAIIGLQNRMGDFLTQFGEHPAEPELAALQTEIDRLAGLREEIAAQFEPVAADLARAEATAPRREATMTPNERKTYVGDRRRLADALGQLQRRLADTQPLFEKLRGQLGKEPRRASADRVVQLATATSSILDELSLVQARSRLEQVTVDREVLDPKDALDIARANRLDWMNNRAALVDTWRLVAFNANKLQSFLNVNFSGDVSTTGDNPVKFRAPTGRLQASLQFDAPLTRLSERNDFRQSLIDYQRDRRRLIQFEDSVDQNLRSTLRELEQLRLNLEIQRRAVIIAIRRVDQTRDVLNQPPPPTQPGEAAAALGPTAALNLLTALNDLRSSQNNFMSVWLNYQANRIRLARELGVMHLEGCGMWIDSPLREAERVGPEEVPLPPVVPGAWLERLKPEGEQAVSAPASPAKPAARVPEPAVPTETAQSQEPRAALQ